MKRILQQTTRLALIGLLVALWHAPGWAATNIATDDPGGGGFDLAQSATVTVTASSLTLVKQIYSGTSCLASSDTSGGADSCNGNLDTIAVPTGTSIQFLIYVRNDTHVQISDLRLQDLLNDNATGGFSYTAASIKTTPTGSLPAHDATAADIYTAANGGTAQTDAIDTGGTNYASMDTSVTPDRLTVGAVVGQVNETLNIPALSTFGVIFSVTKNTD